VLLGCCTGKVENARAAVEEGADFIEVGLNTLMALSDEEFESWAAGLLATGVTIRAANAFMPADNKVVGPDVDADRLSAYVEKAGRRLARLGVKVAVFGSGGSRQVPEGFDHDQALKQLGAFLGAAADSLREHDIVLAVEPLCAAECNIINTVGEGLALIREHCPQVHVLADFFHMSQEKESFDVLAEAGDLLAHVHVSTTDRHGVTPADADAAAFVRRLREVGYTGGCSLECGWDDFPAEIGTSIRALRTWAA
jgi:sugar phosphate isomerase/epimerase